MNETDLRQQRTETPFDKILTLSCRKVNFRMWPRKRGYPAQLITPAGEKATVVVAA